MDTTLTNEGHEGSDGRVVGSTGPSEFLAMRAEQRLVQARRRRWKRAALAVTALGLLGGTVVYRGALARPRSVPAPVVAVEETRLPVAPTPVEPAAPVMATALVEVPAQAEDPSLEQFARCDKAFEDGRWPVAISACRTLFEATPSHTVAMKLAHAHWSRGHTEKAHEWASKALAMGTTDADALVLIGHADRQAGRLAEARAAYESYLQRAPRGWHAQAVRTALQAVEQASAGP